MTKKFSKRELDAYVKSCTDRIKKEQCADGSFFGYLLDPWSSDPEPKAFTPTFVSLLIASCCASVPKSAAARAVRKKLEAFILRNRSYQWTWNYWPLGAEERKIMIYPDDIDDTACALIALIRHDAKKVDGAVMAHVVNALALLEVREGGPYRTWLVGEGFDAIWMDVDLVVNSNIAYMLSLFDIELPEITAFVEEKIDMESYESPYYVPPFSVIYFISRSYSGSKKEAVVAYLLDRRREDGSWGNALDTALAVSSLLNFGYAHERLDKSISVLLDADGEWNPDPLYYYDVSDPERKTMVGAVALTAAFCVEAVEKYRSAAYADRSADHAREMNAEASDDVHDAIVAEVTEYLRSCGKDISESGQSFLKKILARDTERQITLLPYMFRRSLGEKGDAISKEMLIALGLANLYGWTAYTVYDDFLDNEGDRDLLPVANICLRRLVSLFASVLPDSTGFRSESERVMNGIDAANAWEVEYCQISVTADGFAFPESLPDFGDYSRLAERSFGHALGPIAIMLALGITADADTMNDIREFFRHFIIARQINDDAHDWEDDLRRGIINSVSVDILKVWREKNVASVSISFEHDMQALQMMCWNAIMPAICMKIMHHADIAERALERLGLPYPEYLKGLLEGQKKSARKAVHEREETLKFLQAYAPEDEAVCPR